VGIGFSSLVSRECNSSKKKHFTSFKALRNQLFNYKICSQKIHSKITESTINVTHAAAVVFFRGFILKKTKCNIFGSFTVGLLQLIAMHTFYI